MGIDQAAIDDTALEMQRIVRDAVPYTLSDIVADLPADREFVPLEREIPQGLVQFVSHRWPAEPLVWGWYAGVANDLHGIARLDNPSYLSQGWTHWVRVGLQVAKPLGETDLDVEAALSDDTQAGEGRAVLLDDNRGGASPVEERSGAGT